MPTWARAATSGRARSPPTTTVTRSSAPPSARTSTPALIMSSSPRSRSVTVPGRAPDRSSPTTSHPTRWEWLVPSRPTSKDMDAESAVSVELPIPLFATVPGSAPAVSDSHATWMERAPHKRLMLFSGRSNPELGAKIAEHLGIELGQATLKTFTNGEVYVRYEESIRGADMFIVQSCSSPTNDSLMELLIMINAARLASAKRITAVMPWYPNSRQDKKSAPREPITSKLVADMIEAAGADRVLTMDLHAGQLQGFFRIPVDHMTALPRCAQYFRDKGLSGEKVVSVSPDPGRAKMARK